MRPGPAEIDPEKVLVRIEELARAQCDLEQIKAALRCELLLDLEQIKAALRDIDPEDLSAFMELELVRVWVEACALAGQGALQERMWQVAFELVDQPVGAAMAKWLAVNFLGHAKSDVAAEVRRLVAQLKGDPRAQAELLGRALELITGSKGGGNA